MEWLQASIPYAVATLAFSQWPVVWLVLVPIAVVSVGRTSAALAGAVMVWIVIALMQEAGLAGPHLDFRHYGYVIAGAAVIAPWLMLPRLLWPGPQVPATEPAGAARRGALWLLAVVLLFAATRTGDRLLDALALEAGDAIALPSVAYALLSTLLAARWMARGTWLLATPVLAHTPRLRRGIATAAVTGWMLFVFHPNLLPWSLAVAGDHSTAATDARSIESACGTVTAHPEHHVLLLRGGICTRTPADFETVHAAHPGITRIALDSHGGRVAAAIALGTRLAALEFDARVDGQCASACVTVLVGAHRRWVGPDGWVAVHQASANVWAEGGRTVRWPVRPNEALRAFHQARGVSPDLDARATQTPPEQLDVLAADDIVAYGVAQLATDAQWLPAPGGDRRHADPGEDAAP